MRRRRPRGGPWRWRWSRPAAANARLAADRIEALAARILADDRFTAPLAGARLIAGDDLLIVRDAGEAERGGLAPIALEPGQAAVWDGRFELRSAPRRVGAFWRLKGLQARLDAADRERLKAAPAAARPALPVIADPAGEGWFARSLQGRAVSRFARWSARAFLPLAAPFRKNLGSSFHATSLARGEMERGALS